MSAPEKLIKLVERFDDNLDSYKKSNYNETQVRQEFINPMFKLLGWDMDNEEGAAEAYKDVIHSDAIKIGGTTKAPDYCFRIGGTRKFFLEAKKPFVNIKDDIDSAFQLRRYSYSGKLLLSILTNFEEFAVYCSIQPFKNDKASKARIQYFTFKEYTDKWEEIVSIFSPDAIRKGSFDKYAKSAKGKRGTAEVDDDFLIEIESWRVILAKKFASRNPKLTNRQLNEVVQKTIDRIIFLRICEDRGVEKWGQLQSLLNGTNTYSRLCHFFLKADEKYNSGLFHFSPERGREAPDEISLKLKLDEKPLKDIIKRLYPPDSPYEFSVFPLDILGHVYERFLGKVIRLTSGHRAIIEEKPEVRKAGGVYYTPTYIVDYIVKNTVGKLLERKNIKQASQLKILDPACGSGSFLLGAYQYLLDWYLDKYTINKPEKHSKGKSPKICKTQKGEWKLTTVEKKRILLSNIYGVDIDTQAVEVTKLSLLLKVLESETEGSLQNQLKLFHERALPDLGNNIKCGNSLIGSDYYVGKQITMFDEEEMYKINAFDWDKEFEQTIKTGGFDVVIGNPPWGATLELKEKDYLSKLFVGFLGNYDSYLFFIEKAICLVKNEGTVSFITPDTWIKVPQAKGLRKIVLNNSGIKQITTLPNKVFKKVSANCIVFVLCKAVSIKECSINIMLPDTNLSLLGEEQFDDRYNVKVSSWEKNKDIQYQIYQKDEIAKLISRIQLKCSQVVKFLDVMQGIVPYSRENHPDNTVKNRLFHSSNKLSNEYGLWTQGRSISRYNISIEKKEYLKYGKWLHRPRKKKYFEGQRILIQEITGGHPPRISACHCNTVLYHDPGIISCLNIEDVHIFYVLGIINSLFLSWYHRYSSPKGYRQVFPKVLIGDIRNLPIPPISLNNKIDKSLHDKIVKSVERMLDLNKQLIKTKILHGQTLLKRQIEAIDRQIDQLVYELYGLTDKEIKIVESG